MPPLICRSEALVMRHLNYGEADRIVTLLTPAHGMIKGFARAARKSRKRFGVGLEPFSRIEIQWRAGRSDLCLLQDAELLDARSGLRGDLQNFALACYGIELVEMLLHEGEPHPDIYQLLQAYLDCLAGGGEQSFARLLLELRLIARLGYGPHLLHCSACFEHFSAGRAAFDAERGGGLCLACAGSAPHLHCAVGTLGSLARCLRTPVGRFEGFRFGTTTLREGRELLDSVLRRILPRPLKSLAFLTETTVATDP
jgi:DNA repair protein RecO (recombination protein O)